LVPQRFGRIMGAPEQREAHMGRHLADHRSRTTGGRVKHFLRLARNPRETWLRPRGKAGTSRLVQFLRIARGRTT
jgi:hypothetical protein